jgi:hypothetical protein
MADDNATVCVACGGPIKDMPTGDLCHACHYVRTFPEAGPLGIPVSEAKMDAHIPPGVAEIRAEHELVDALIEIKRLRAELATVSGQRDRLREAGEELADRVRDSLVNLAEWQYDPGEDALDAWEAALAEQADAPAPGEE